MDVKLLNQYRMIVDVDKYGKEERVFRTKKTLEDLKTNINSIDGLVSEGAEWKREGQGFFVYARVMNSNGDMNTVRSFHSDKDAIGYKGMYSIDEIEQYDMAWVKGYGYVEDFKDFKREFELSCEKKVASPLSDVYTAGEADEKWGLYQGAVRQSCNRGKLKGHNGVRQSGKVWLVTDEAMNEVFGNK